MQVCSVHDTALMLWCGGGSDNITSVCVITPSLHCTALHCTLGTRDTPCYVGNFTSAGPALVHCIDCNPFISSGGHKDHCHTGTRSVSLCNVCTMLTSTELQLIGLNIKQSTVWLQQYNFTRTVFSAFQSYQARITLVPPNLPPASDPARGIH